MKNFSPPIFYKILLVFRREYQRMGAYCPALMIVLTRKYTLTGTNPMRHIILTMLSDKL